MEQQDEAEAGARAGRRSRRDDLPGLGEHTPLADTEHSPKKGEDVEDVLGVEAWEGTAGHKLGSQGLELDGAGREELQAAPAGAQ